MRRTLLAVAVLTVPMCAGLAPAGSDSPADRLARADQAFAAADYKTAAGLYQQVAPTLTDASQKAAVDERLRVAQKQMAMPTTAPSPDSASPATQPTAADQRIPHVRPADGQTLTTTLHGLGNFDYNEDDDHSIPADVRKLDGCHVKIDGVMLPLDQAGRVTRFLLVNDMMSCCYGTAPKLQNVAMVDLPKDKWIAATTDRLAIEGTLHVSVKREDGFVMSIFQITPSSIKFAAQ